MSRNLKKEIETREKELLTYVENKVIEMMTWFCQFRLHYAVRSTVLNNERKKIEEEILPIVMENLKKIAPLHFSYCSIDKFMHPFEGIYRASYMWEQYQDDAESYKNYSDKWKTWPCITYNMLEEAGFSKDFSKRNLERFVDESIIVRKSDMGGYRYMIKDLKSISDRIKHVRHGVASCQFSYEFYTKDDWMYDGFSDESLKEYFDKTKSKLISTIEENF